METTNNKLVLSRIISNTIARLLIFVQLAKYIYYIYKISFLKKKFWQELINFIEFPDKGYKIQDIQYKVYSINNSDNKFRICYTILIKDFGYVEATIYPMDVPDLDIECAVVPMYNYEDKASEFYLEYCKIEHKKRHYQ